MNVIELENRTAEEVFKELKYRLDAIGSLPDEYILMDKEWGNGKMIPEGADIFCTTDYGGSEGIYLDCYLKWYENGKPVTKSFFTGKTLGDSGSDMDRMFLISSAITKAFHGDGGQYDRYMRLGETDSAGGMTLHLDADEQRVFIEALAAQRERLLENTVQTEQLLRRMTGSITAYMDLVGQYPLRVSDFDRAILAIHDGNLDAFKEVIPRVIDRADDLLVAAAGRPGAVGDKMCVLVHAGAHGFSGEAYLAACKAAIKLGDTNRVQFLLEQAPRSAPTLDESFHGEVLELAYQKKPHMGKALIELSTPEQIAAAPPSLLYRTAREEDFPTSLELVRKGIQTEKYADQILRTLLSSQRREWMASSLLDSGMKVGADNYPALYTCIHFDALDCGKKILDQGMDFEQYRQWAVEHGKDQGVEEAMDSLREHWESKQAKQEQRAEMAAPSQGPELGGMSL